MALLKYVLFQNLHFNKWDTIVNLFATLALLFLFIAFSAGFLLQFNFEFGLKYICAWLTVCTIVGIPVIKLVLLAKTFQKEKKEKIVLSNMNQSGEIIFLSCKSKKNRETIKKKTFFKLL